MKRVLLSSYLCGTTLVPTDTLVCCRARGATSCAASTAQISRLRAATFFVSATSGPLSREIQGPRDTIDAAGCSQKRVTRSWSATSRLEAVNRKTTKQSQFRRTPVESLSSNDEPRSADLAVEIRGLCGPPLADSTTRSGAASPHRPENQDSRRVNEPDSLVAHALSVPRRDSSRRLAQVGHPSSGNAPNTTKRTQSRRTPVESLSSNDEPRSADLAVEIRGLCGPLLADSTTRSGAASPHRPENQDSRRVNEPDSFVAHALSVPRRDSSRRLAQFGHPSSANAPNTTKRTQSRRTPVESSADCRSVDHRAAGGRVCERTGDSPRRHARTGRFINDLREARGLYPGFFHRPGSPQAKPLKNTAPVRTDSRG